MNETLRKGIDYSQSQAVKFKLSFALQEGAFKSTLKRIKIVTNVLFGYIV